MRKDYYEILEVSRNASEEVIKTAYKSLVKKYHPDNTGNIEDDKRIIEIKEAYEVLSNPQRRKAYDEYISMESDDTPSAEYYRNMNDTKYTENKFKEKKVFLWIILIGVLIWGVKSIQFDTGSNESTEEMDVLISVQRTGNILTNIGALEVWIDGEKVFEVDGNSTNSVVVAMPLGKHTIQVEGQGDKSKKIQFNVTENGENEFYYSAEISNWFGVKLKKRNYIPEK
jgi:hypothetical protein